MNSIASPRRTEAGGFARGFGDARAATIAATLIFTVLLVTFRPFQPSSELVPKSGDIINQLGFASLGAIALFSLLTLSDGRRTVAMLSPWWLLLLGFMFLAVLHAGDPSSAMRAALFAVIAMIGVATVVVLPRDGDAYSTVFLVTGGIVLGLCYLGVLLLPGTAIHTADALESQHAGFWRGSFAHKNIAGPVMACLSFAGLYVFRRGRRLAGGLLFGAAMLFMANTGSKTTAGLVPLAILLVMAPRLIGMNFLAPLFFLVAIVGTALATIGIVLIPPLKLFAAENFPELTYTGRTALWGFLGEMIAKRPWSGYGLDGFWGSPFMETVETPFDQDWDITGIVHGHNGYLDLAAIQGLPALAVALVAFIVAPLRDFVRTPNLKENVLLADFFLMVLLFTTLNAFLESFFFRRADPVWLFLVMACIGLRLTARFPLPSRSPPR